MRGIIFRIGSVGGRRSLVTCCVSRVRMLETHFLVFLVQICGCEMCSWTSQSYCSEMEALTAITRLHFRMFMSAYVNVYSVNVLQRMCVCDSAFSGQSHTRCTATHNNNNNNNNNNYNTTHIHVHASRPIVSHTQIPRCTHAHNSAYRRSAKT